MVASSAAAISVLALATTVCKRGTWRDGDNQTRSHSFPSLSLSNSLSAEPACSNFPSGLDLTACWWCQWPGWTGWVQCSQDQDMLWPPQPSQLLPPATNTTTSRSGQQRHNLQHSACTLSQVFIVFRYSIVLLIPLVVFLIFYPRRIQKCARIGYGGGWWLGWLLQEAWACLRCGVLPLTCGYCGCNNVTCCTDLEHRYTVTRVLPPPQSPRSQSTIH